MCLLPKTVLLNLVYFPCSYKSQWKGSLQFSRIYFTIVRKWKKVIIKTIVSIMVNATYKSSENKVSNKKSQLKWSVDIIITTQAKNQTWHAFKLGIKLLE